jgi:hypothetical protein
MILNGEIRLVVVTNRSKRNPHYAAQVEKVAPSLLSP